MNTLEKRKVREDEIQIVPLLKACFNAVRANWLWFVLSAILCLVIGYIYQQRQMRTYQRQAVMLIEDSDGQGGSIPTSRKNRGNMNMLLELNGISVGDNLKNEMFILTSRRIMQRVADTLHLDVCQRTERSLHQVDLYGEEPLKLEFANRNKDGIFQMNAKIQENGHVVFYNIQDLGISDSDPKYWAKKKIDVAVGATFDTPAGKAKLTKGLAFDEFPKGKEIDIIYYPLNIAASLYKNGLNASEYDKESSLIVLTCRDHSTKRAEDILNEIFMAYKRDVVDNKNRVANNTARFIEDRLNIIGQELGQVESQMADFKQRSNIIDFKESAAEFTRQNAAAHNRELEAETKLSVARYLLEYLQDNANSHHLYILFQIYHFYLYLFFQ